MLCFSLLKLLENCFVLFLAWVFLMIIPICASIHHLFVLPKSPQDTGFTGLALGGPRGTKYHFQRSVATGLFLRNTRMREKDPGGRPELGQLHCSLAEQASQLKLYL